MIALSMLLYTRYILYISNKKKKKTKKTKKHTHTHYTHDMTNTDARTPIYDTQLSESDFQAYLGVIAPSHCMDLSTLRQNLEDHVYKTLTVCGSCVMCHVCG